MASKTHIKRLHGALAGAGLMREKPTFLGAYGVESSKDLTDQQADDLIQRLNAMKTNRYNPGPKVRKHRHITLSILTDMEVMKHSTDWDSVNNYLLKPRIGGKLLYEYDLERLKGLNRRLRRIARQRRERLEQETYEATNN